MIFLPYIVILNNILALGRILALLMHCCSEIDSGNPMNEQLVLLLITNISTSQITVNKMCRMCGSIKAFCRVVVFPQDQSAVWP